MKLDLHYQVTGDGQPFVFQHGLGALLQQAQGLMGPLEKVKLIAVDSRGHGKSPLLPDVSPSFQRYTDDVLRVLDHLGIDQAWFGGISMGSGISLRMALSYPDRVKGLVLVRPAWLDKPFPEHLMMLADLIDYLDLPDGKEQYAQTPIIQSIQQTLPSAAASILGQFDREPKAAVPITLKQMVGDAPFASMEELAQLNKPCLVIGNHDDPLHPHELAATLAAAIPGAQFETVVSRYVDDAKHREVVRRIVSEFLLNK